VSLFRSSSRAVASHLQIVRNGLQQYILGTDPFIVLYVIWLLKGKKAQRSFYAGLPTTGYYKN
jgi:hypothetical protein